jgi:cell division protein FtsI (penicillin-binding protein 3)
VTTRPARSARGADAPRMESAVVDRRIRGRLQLAMVGLAVALVAMSVWVGLHQSLWRPALAAASYDQRTRVDTLRADRGTIFDRNGNELALSVPSTTIYADPGNVADPVATASAIGPLLGWSDERIVEFASDLSESDRSFLYVARQLDAEQAEPVLALGLAGIHSYGEPKRVVDSGVAESVIGRTDPDGIGISGLEMQYEEMLKGIDGRSVRQRDGKGNSISVSSVRRSVPGDDLVLTIDKTLQYRTDLALIQRVRQTNARGGTVIIMDSRTGDIHAMSNVRRSEDDTVEIAAANFAAVEAYEPGSVAKVFSVSAALNEETVAPDTTFRVPGAVTVDGFRITDAYPHGLVDMTVRRILVKSSNLGTSLIAQTMAPDTLHDYLTGFGFGSPTSLGYPNESNGILAPASKWYGTVAMTVPYGYGFAASPLQLIAGVNTVANDGRYVSPRLVRATVDRRGEIREADPSESREVLRPETAHTMTEILRGVVCLGTAQLAQVKGTAVAGKTGTGYKAQDNGTYLSDAGSRKYFASFVGYFPAHDPRVTILVSIDEPDAGSQDRFGGTAAAPLFARLAEVTMHHLKIPASETGTGCAAGVEAG